MYETARNLFDYYHEHLSLNVELFLDTLSLWSRTLKTPRDAITS